MAYADSIRIANPTIEQVATLIEGIFSSGYPTTFSSFVPAPAGGGAMTYSSVTVSRALYVQIGKIVFCDVLFSGTIGGTLSGTVTFTLPVAAASDHRIVVSTTNNSSLEAGFILFASSSTSATLQRTGGANWTAGTAELRSFFTYKAA